MVRVMVASSEAVSEAVALLSADHIVVVPTSRWFMICCRATAQERIEEIFAMKRRAASKQPLFVLPHKEQTTQYFRISTAAGQLIEKLWPGELSLLLPWRDTHVGEPFRGVDRLAPLVYCPPGIFGEIAAGVGVPLAATTVNISDFSVPESPGPAISVEEVSSFLRCSKCEVGLVIDGGICPACMPTTIMDCRETNGTPTIVREGYVNARAVRLALCTAA